MAASRQDLVELIRAGWFTSEHIRDICFDLQIDWENLDGNTRDGKGRNLIDFAIRHSMLPNLEARMRARNPAAFKSLSQNATSVGHADIPSVGIGGQWISFARPITAQLEALCDSRFVDGAIHYDVDRLMGDLARVLSLVFDVYSLARAGSAAGVASIGEIPDLHIVADPLFFARQHRALQSLMSNRPDVSLVSSDVPALLESMIAWINSAERRISSARLFCAGAMPMVDLGPVLAWLQWYRTVAMNILGRMR